MDAKLDLDQAEIQDLATEINAAIGDVSEVEQIITETADNLAVAQDLKSRAEDAELQAKAELAKAEKVAEDLSQAEESQNAADDAVTQTKQDIDSARSDLGQVCVNLNFKTTIYKFAESFTSKNICVIIHHSSQF